MTYLAALLKQLPALIVALGVLATVTILAYTGHIDATYAESAIVMLIGAIGITGIVVLMANAIPNAMLIAHGVFAVAVLASITLLALHSVFTQSEIEPLLSLIIVGAVGGAGVGTYSVAVSASRGQHTPGSPGSSYFAPLTDESPAAPPITG